MATKFIHTWSEIGVDSLRSGENYFTCPECSKDRKKSKIKCFCVNLEKNVGHCSHCDITYVLVAENKKDYKRPEWKNETHIDNKVVQYFEKRKISQETLIRAKVTTGKDFIPQEEAEVNCIHFNYFRDNELINIKSRSNKKNFKLFKDAELIIYNLDSIKDTKECIIVEGEPDCLSFIQAGIYNVVSVPNGANKNRNNLQYIDNCYKYFENKEKIYIAVDNDEAGVNLKNELIERLDADKCFIVDFKDCKDANEYLVKYGVAELSVTIQDAKRVPITGIIYVNEIIPQILELYKTGLQPGLLINYSDHDKCISFPKSILCTITGIPTHGKSEYLDWVAERLSVLHDVKFAVFSPENFPIELHVSKLAEKIIGKKFRCDAGMNIDELNSAVEFINNHFYFIRPDEIFTMDYILKKTKQLILRHGVNALIIDPFNKVQKDLTGQTETQFIQELLNKLNNFKQRTGVRIFLVAHPTKMKKQKDSNKYEIPTLYDIAGSAEFYNQTDLGISIYRDFDQQIIDFYFQKVKFKHWGTGGFISTKYNINNGRFIPNDISDKWDNSNHLIIEENETNVIQQNESFDFPIEPPF